MQILIVYSQLKIDIFNNNAKNDNKDSADSTFTPILFMNIKLKTEESVISQFKVSTWAAF